MSNSSMLKFQITIPNGDTPQDEPTLAVILDSQLTHESTDQVHQCSLNELFDQVSKSYGHDKSALHRFSYYLLLQAKEFAQDDVLSDEDMETVLEIKE